MKRHVKNERYFWIWFSYNMELDHWRDEVYWLSYTVFDNIDLTVYFTYVQMSWKMIVNGGYVWIWKGEMLSDNNINFTRARTVLKKNNCSLEKSLIRSQPEIGLSYNCL
jgi:hypothetical protein